MRWTGSPFRIRIRSHVGVGIFRNDHGAHRCRHVVPGMLSLLPIAIQHEAEPGLDMNTVWNTVYRTLVVSSDVGSFTFKIAVHSSLPNETV